MKFILYFHHDWNEFHLMFVLNQHCFFIYKTWDVWRDNRHHSLSTELEVCWRTFSSGYPRIPCFIHLLLYQRESTRRSVALLYRSQVRLFQRNLKIMLSCIQWFVWWEWGFIHNKHHSTIYTCTVFFTMISLPRFFAIKNKQHRNYIGKLFYKDLLKLHKRFKLIKGYTFASFLQIAICKKTQQF